jgi:malonyl-CoA/methylmalonyl-CoA synthetase
MTINESQVLSPGGPGVVFLTSGTSGPPKVAVLPRQCLVAEQLAPPGGAGINCRQGHWIGGADGMLEPILTGQSLHCIGQQATAAEVLQAFVDHRITHALFGPLLLTRMRDLIVGPTGVLSDQARRKYCTLFRGLLSIRGGGANIEPAVRQFWVNLTGLPYENFYASTELGMRACSSLSGEDVCIYFFPFMLSVLFSS